MSHFDADMQHATWCKEKSARPSEAPRACRRVRAERGIPLARRRARRVGERDTAVRCQRNERTILQAWHGMWRGREVKEPTQAKEGIASAERGCKDTRDKVVHASQSPNRPDHCIPQPRKLNVARRNGFCTTTALGTPQTNSPVWLELVIVNRASKP